MITSARSPFRRQYSCACSTCRASGRPPTAADVDQQDGQVARDAVPPEARLTELVPGDRLPRRAQGTVGAKHTRSQAFEEQRLVIRDRQMVERALRVPERQRKRARDGAGIAVFLRQGLSGVAVAGHTGGKRQPHRRARRESDALPQAEDRIQDDATGARKRSSVERSRHAWIPSSAQELRSIGFPLDRTLRPAFKTQHVHGPNRRFTRIAASSMAQERRAGRQVLGFEKQLRKRRVRQIGNRGRQRNLDITGHIDLAYARSLIRDREPTNFDVVLGRHRDIDLRHDGAITTTESSPDRGGTRPGSRQARSRWGDRWATRRRRSRHRAGRCRRCPDRVSRHAATV